jgi:hypothetical protein
MSLSHADRLDLNAAFPDMRSRSLNKCEHIQKRARRQPALMADRAYMLTPDWWESARFQAVDVAWSWVQQSGVLSSRPPAGNAHRWAVH